MSSIRRAVVLVVDGWGAGFLGPYGNTWLETPTCNQLAAEGLLLEHPLVDSPTLEAFYRAVWQGTHAVLFPQATGPSLAQILARQQRSSCLITDARELLDHPLAESFGRAEWVPAGQQDEPAESSEQTQLARVLATAAAALEDDPPGLCWIHASGMLSHWDAPLMLREQFRDEDDPPLPDAVRPPSGQVPKDSDPDLIQGWVWAYAGQVALLDELLDGLLARWRRITEPALLVVMGARGFALAEHGVWGAEPEALYSEHLHVPLLVVSNTGELAGFRSQQLVQPHHLHATLLDWFVHHRDAPPDAARRSSLLSLVEHDLSAADAGWPPLAATRLDRLWALRTPAWHASGASSDAPASSRPRLFLKPDDRWDVNDVADRCPEIVDRFIQLQFELQRMSCADHPAALPLLDPELLFRPGVNFGAG